MRITSVNKFVKELERDRDDASLVKWAKGNKFSEQVEYGSNANITYTFTFSLRRLGRNHIAFICDPKIGITLDVWEINTDNRITYEDYITYKDGVYDYYGVEERSDELDDIDGSVLEIDTTDMRERDVYKAFNNWFDSLTQKIAKDRNFEEAELAIEYRMCDEYGIDIIW